MFISQQQVVAELNPCQGGLPSRPPSLQAVEVKAQSSNLGPLGPMTTSHGFIDALLAQWRRAISVLATTRAAHVEPTTTIVPAAATIALPLAITFL